MSEKDFPEAVQIPLGIAKEWKERFQEDNTPEDPKTKVTSYLIPRKTLEKVLELETEVVRAYLGINDEKLRTLLFVGAKLDEKTGKYVDVYGQEGSVFAKSADNVEGGDVVYDGIRPSPPF
ncbi:hypothetical protein [Flavobacterium johnsoniae]|uniref:Uncharacterized protein n=1 Tax=Flavobacterium johnsoniae TaxID=986 RepID=A0A1J7CQS1_FLAJO|nr:hypothetical protein [Flavobacterium johnsoniae]OIV43916.1 hypothetical protein BKM63_01570 [Flavobacterium johnsoniae]